MDVFALRDDLVETYRDYATSFVPLRDDRVRCYVEAALESGWLWPNPRVGLNPSFESGGPVDGLVTDGVLHPGVSDVFRRDKSESDVRGREMRLYRHQVEAVRAASAGQNYVLTTGTGSGKSLAYMIPIVDHVLREGSGRGVQAVVVYPMNALVNSQLDELGKYLGHGPWADCPVTFGRYTGQEDLDARERILGEPPDVLLTNYVMLELILTRHTDQRLVQSFRSLRFLVLDELHTYRGRQGADVSLLVRRLREASGASDLLCVGTSATLSTEGSFEDRQTSLASVGSLLFGAPVEPAAVISETLERVTYCRAGSDAATDAVLAETVERCYPPSTYDDFIDDPLASWLESTFGVQTDAEGRLVRAVPRPVIGEGGAASELAIRTGLSEASCENAIRLYLLAGSGIPKPGGAGQVFPFRLHQFVSRGDTVYASPEPPAVRSLSLDGQRFAPGSDRRLVLLPLAFCRECGQDYYTVRRGPAGAGSADRLFRRELSDRSPVGDLEAGFVYLSDRRPWPDNPANQLRRLPREWIGPDGRLLASRRGQVPAPLMLGADGSVGDPDGTAAWWVPAPFRFCLACRVYYTSPRGSDFARLSTLGSGGRASATTVMSVAAVQHLKSNPGLGSEARKLLSFTDNRQDASLQAGHFNDFVEVTTLRSALRRAVTASEGGVPHDQLPRRVFDMLGLREEVYALTAGLRGRARRNTERTMLDVLSYRLYRDLRRGWRVTQPNLEQVGLLRIGYDSLSDLASDQELWDGDGCHRALAECGPRRREFVIRVLLDWMRSQLAIRVNVLTRHEQETLKLRAEQWLKGSWALENEDLEPATEVLTRPKRPTDRRHWRHVTGRGTFGLFLRNNKALGAVLPGENLTVADRDQIIRQLFERMETYGLVAQVEGGRDGNHRRWQIRAGALVWRTGDGTPYRDHLRTVAGEQPAAPNSYFVDLYGNTAPGLAGLKAREHTAQVPADERENREERFRTAELPVLFCSPTMELGVDISELNVVNMRNVPPTPANYAQRSGRAGRGGQPALVFTYCASGNSHDQYFFAQPERMIAGQVEAPRIDLANESLLRAHVHAVWLAESGLDLGQSMIDILDIADGGSQARPTLKARVQDGLHDRRARERARRRADRMLEDLMPELSGQDWWQDSWLDDTLLAIPKRFDQALDRWMTLYTAAVRQADEQHRISLSQSRSARDRQQAERLRADAVRQLKVLRAKADTRGQSDFYTYRYFASEGFLPGYAFPRLPLSAYIPGRRRQRFGQRTGHYLQRPRFLAVSEFGPQAHIYHEGARYQINKVILSPGGDELQNPDGEAGLTDRAKRCGECGYMHPFGNPPGPDTCDNCSAVLPRSGWDDRLLLMRNVSTVRRDRITSDEERRRRAGYEIISGIRFAPRSGGRGRSKVRTSLRAGGPDRDSADTLLELTYGDTATIWRMNLGWRRRTSDHHGFLLNVETGGWASQRGSATDPDPDAATTERVVPYVKDSRNVLLVEAGERWPEETLASLEQVPHDDPTDENRARVGQARMMASLAAALKAAIQVVFHLEPSELAVEPLPSRDDRRLLLFYEATEGGAGALRQLVASASRWRQVAQTALDICHVGDPDSECGGACYHCLLTYQNQWDHELLDRTHVIPFLQLIADAELAIPAHQQKLETTSSLEADFIIHLREGGYRLPDDAQEYFPEAATRPDFIYHDACVAIYVDGPHHDYPDRAERDRTQEEAMRELGLRCLRFSYRDRDSWERIVADHRDVFGPGHRK